MVRDFGAGMPPATLRRIFDPYYTTKAGPDESGKGGTGIGLSTCKNIIEAHGGKIRVESSVGKGTCFTLMLPMEASQAINSAATSGDSEFRFSRCSIGSIAKRLAARRHSNRTLLPTQFQPLYLFR